MPTESVICPHCRRTCGSGPGLASHVRSMHPTEWRREQEARATPSRGARPLASVPSVPPPSPSSNGNGSIVWEEPPPMRRARARIFELELTPLIVELKRHPGDWGRIKEYPNSKAASAGASAARKLFPDVEFVARGLKAGSAIWARFVEEA